MERVASPTLGPELSSVPVHACDTSLCVIDSSGVYPLIQGEKTVGREFVWTSIPQVVVVGLVSVMPEIVTRIPMWALARVSLDPGISTTRI